MIGSYPDVTAGGDGDGDDVDMATLLRMQAQIEATRQQADDAEEKVASMSGTILALTPLMERLEKQVAASTAPAFSAGEAGAAVQGGSGGGGGGGGGGVRGGDAEKGTVGRSFVGVGGRTDSTGVVSVQGPETEVRPREVHQLQHPSDGASQEVTMRRVDPAKDRMGMVQGKGGRGLEVDPALHVADREQEMGAASQVFPRCVKAFPTGVRTFPAADRKKEGAPSMMRSVSGAAGLPLEGGRHVEQQQQEQPAMPRVQSLSSGDDALKGRSQLGVKGGAAVGCPTPGSRIEGDSAPQAEQSEIQQMSRCPRALPQARSVVPGELPVQQLHMDGSLQHVPRQPSATSSSPARPAIEVGSRGGGCKNAAGPVGRTQAEGRPSFPAFSDRATAMGAAEAGPESVKAPRSGSSLRERKVRVGGKWRMLTPAELLRAEELREGRETAIRAEEEAGKKEELEARRIEKLDRDQMENMMAVKECDGKGSKTRPEDVIMDGRRVPRAGLQTRAEAAARERKQGHDGLDVREGGEEEKRMEEQGLKEGKESGTKSPGDTGSDGGKMQVAKPTGR
ncbi:unnamed protein product [Scytosiphon promiscuus]